MPLEEIAGLWRGHEAAGAADGSGAARRVGRLLADAAAARASDVVFEQGRDACKVFAIVNDRKLPLASPLTADAAVKGVAAQLARSRQYHPMLLSAANAGAGALPAAGDGGGGMVSGLLEFIDLDSVIVADSGNPIADLAALGHGLLNAALAAIVALMGAATGSGLLESIPFIGKGLDVFESAWQVADQLKPKAPKLAALMDEAQHDVLAYMSFPREHRQKLHSTNPLERLNGEIKRRTNVVGIFPNEDAITRLVGAILLEQNDEWAVSRRYMTLESIAQIRSW